MKKCYLCQGEIEQKLVTVEREWKGKKIIIENVPAEVCDQCGERYFDAETTFKMEKIKKATDFPQEQIISIPASVRKFDRLSGY
ncbi:type II toxin-antitoxin system MqsA family antitoxin [Fodinisporobacter ferrooxydans]|uniref:Type II toxin-antitoxin system MqsA family antitoxin n=1 Tax=Fodinisporobacter ferrooxydans TaxID=2901836 RepID=A0ABY4CJM0_9BACL|nr:type II toxin-antitoxin system MqsA family antitoxin [Alicyclobacillaceae bacterium MYW30-H2]